MSTATMHMSGKAGHHAYQTSGFIPEIEGLRALAVLAVVIYHSKADILPGGFVGVDMFFVISGFLITRLLIKELAGTGKIDIISFWARRARRLVPHALIVLCACFGIGYFIVAPHRWPDMATDLSMAAIQLSNYWFSSKLTDYFTYNDPQSVALHFWSLSIEEQFYIVWPFILFVLYKIQKINFSRNFILVALTIMIISIFINFQYMEISQRRAFFHLEARIWQLATGALIVGFIDHIQKINPLGLYLARQCGLAGMLIAIFIFNDQMDYPGVASLLPTLSAAAFIVGVNGPAQKLAPYSIPDPASGLVLMPGMGWLGARSYGWYLWHWPLMLAAGTFWPGQSIAMLLAAALGLVLAALVFVAVENPIRRNDTVFAGRFASIGMAVISIAVFCAAAYAFPQLGHFQTQAAKQLVDQLAAARIDLGRNYTDLCHLDLHQIEQPDCEYGNVGAQKRVVLFGDSHAAQWFSALEESASRQGWSLRAWTKSSCPSADVAIYYPPKRAYFQECDQWRTRVMERLTGLEKPDLVIISNLSIYSGWLWDKVSKQVIWRAGADAELQRGLSKTLIALSRAGVPVLVIRDTPSTYVSASDCLAREGGKSCERPKREALGNSANDIEVAHRIGGKTMSIDLTEKICSPIMCPLTSQERIIYRDSHHLTSNFARSLSHNFDIYLKH
ncbi:MAG: acyltransferase family protein [Bosea sp. (in: a-proteobacteria)]